MGLFFDVLSAINNPNQQASVSQLESVTNSIQQLTSSRGIDSSQMQNVMSVVGNVLQPMLKQQRSTMGGNQLENLIGQAIGTGGMATGLQSLLSSQSLQQISQTVSQKTGLSPNLIQTMLPTLIPAVMSLLKMGAPKPGVQGSNPLLNAFLDSDRDGDTDLGDVMRFANRFLNPTRP